MTTFKDLFPLGKIVSSEDVVDREEFIEETKLRLLQGQSAMLSGPRRIGKTSVAYEILRQLREEGAYVAKIDLFHVTSIEEMGTKLLQAILENRTGVLHQAVYTLKQWKKDLLASSEIHAKLYDLEMGLTLDRPQSPLDLLETAVQTAEKMASKDDKRMVILLDEFQELDRLGGETLLKRLRSLFQQQKHTTYFFLGSERSLLTTLFADRRQAFYRFATILPLPQIPYAKWRTYIVVKLKESVMTMTEPALDWLLDKTGGHPYCLMSVMSNAYLLAIMGHQDTINMEILYAAYERSMSQLEAVYEEQWQEIRNHKGLDHVLTSILLNQPIHHPTEGISNVSRAVQTLIRLSIIQKGEHRGKYHVMEPMFGDWVLRKRGE